VLGALAVVGKRIFQAQVQRLVYQREWNDNQEKKQRLQQLEADIRTQEERKAALEAAKAERDAAIRVGG
jgi:hypothetical protein